MKSKFLSNFLDRVSQLIFAKTGWDVAKTGKLVEGSLKYSLEGRMKDGEHQEIGNGRNKGEKQNTPTRIDADAQYEIGRQTRDGKYEAKAEGPYEPLPHAFFSRSGESTNASKGHLFSFTRTGMTR